MSFFYLRVVAPLGSTHLATTPIARPLENMKIQNVVIQTFSHISYGEIKVAHFLHVE